MAAHRGRVPLESHLLRVMGVWDFGSFPTDTSFVVDRPPTHFFVKKKFIPIGGANTATQKVLSGFCYAHTLCGAGSPPHAGGSFFLYEKSVLRESDSLRGRRSEVCTGLAPLFPALKEALKKMGFQRDASLWQELEGRALEVFPL